MIWLPVFDSWKVCCLASTSDSLFTESLGEGRSHTPGSDDLALCVIRYAMHVCAKSRHWRSEKMLYLLLRVLADAYIGVRGELHRRLCLCSPLPSAVPLFPTSVSLFFCVQKQTGRHVSSRFRAVGHRTWRRQDFPLFVSDEMDFPLGPISTSRA